MSSVTLKRRQKSQRRTTPTPTLDTKEEKDEEERGRHFHYRIVVLFWVVVFWSILSGNHLLCRGKTCPILYWPDTFRRNFIKLYCLLVLDTPRA